MAQKIGRPLGVYAVYKGEDLLVMGTLNECAKELGIKRNTVAFYGTPSYRKRTTEKALRTVRIE